MSRHLPSIVAFALAALACPALAVTEVFIPAADTSLLEISPGNNLGGFIGMNAGTTQEGKRTRALMLFDLSALPTNAVILSAQLRLEVTRQPDEPPNNSSFALHRMLRTWGEGDKSPIVQAGKGLPATDGEATWLHAFHATNAWTAPGGAADVDFSSIESSSQFIYGVGESPYFFESSPEMVADVTGWVRSPAANFGWMLKCNDEGTIFTARRFGTHESPDYPPNLTIEYLVPPTISVLSLKLNLATSLYEQRVRVTNPAGSTPDALRVMIKNLSTNVQVANASGITNGAPYVQSSVVVPPDSSVDFVIEYYTSGGAVPNPTLEAELTPVASAALPPTNNGQRINRARRLPNGTFLLEFATVSNRVYHVQYSTDLLEWKAAPPAITGNGTWCVWIDSGQPKTDAAPAVTGQRYYRVVFE